MQLNLCLCSLLLQAVCYVQCSTGQWTANIPRSLPALQGSCVVIPCTYTYPPRKSGPILNRWRGFWKLGRKIISTNLPKWKVPLEFKRRTQFLGDLRTRNCTMLLDGVRQTDVGPFYFRIEMPQYKSFTYTKNTVYIDVMRDPEPPFLDIEIGDKVKASCYVSHTCPSMPPQFSWSRTGVISYRSKKLSNGVWQSMSVLTFNPRPRDFNMPLNCTVVHRGRKQATNSTILRI